MTEKHTDHTPDKVNTDITSVLGAGFNEQDALAVGVEGTASGFKVTSTRSAVLFVKRGPNAGARFLLDRPVTSAGRHPDSDIFLDDTTVSREPVGSAVLASGDEIQIAKFRLVYLTGPTTDTQSDSGQPATEHEGLRLRTPRFNTQPQLNHELEAARPSPRR